MLIHMALLFGLTVSVAGCGMIRGREAAGQDASLRDGAGGEVTVAETIHGSPPRFVGQRAPARRPVASIVAASDAADRVEIERRSVLYALHLASYRTESSAAAGWGVLTTEVPDVLAGLHARVETVDLGPEQGVFHRLKAGPLDSRAEATARCAALSGAGYYCRAVDFEGRDVGS